MKKILLKNIQICYFFACCFLLFTNYACAYIDPSTVTYIIQGVAGVFITIGAVITIFRHKIRAAWRKWYYGKIAKRNQQKINASEAKEEK